MNTQPNQPKYYVPKILIAAPQHESKKYCFDDWYMNVRKINHPRFDILLVDNSDTDHFYKYMKNYNVYLHRIETKNKTTLQKMAESHDFIRKTAIENKYDYLLHLETDVFPDPDILINLLSHKKDLVGCLYSILAGASRELCLVEAHYDTIINNIYLYRNPLSIVELGKGIRQTFNCGIGCTLFSRKVLPSFQFRYVEGIENHPDSWMAYDLMTKNIPYFVDTNTFVEHRNSAYGWHNIH